MSTFVCSLVCEDEKQAVAVKSQLQQLARPMYSNPPVHGALIVSIILGDPDLKQLWLKEVKVLISYNPSSLLLIYFIGSQAIMVLIRGGYVISQTSHVGTIKKWKMLNGSNGSKSLKVFIVELSLVNRRKSTMGHAPKLFSVIFVHH